MKPVTLIVMDGWGVNPAKEGNAIVEAGTPNLSGLEKAYPHTTLEASGLAVGLPSGQMGNSEVGHLTIGAGRTIYQDFTRITKAIEEGSFQQNPVLNAILINIKESKGSLHLMGLLSDGGVHSHITHLYALIEAAKRNGLERVYVHAFLDGRDTPPDSGRGYMRDLCSFMEKTGLGSVATVSGRYYAMDRDNRWDRVKKAYDAITVGRGREADDPVKAVEDAYERGETDEFVTPTVIKRGDGPVATVDDNDGVIFFNFRADRARELTRAFIEEDFNGFTRKRRPKLTGFVTMTEYDAGFNVPVLFPPQDLKNTLGEVLSSRGIRQFRVSETEKYAHVTFFFNGGVEKAEPGEDRLLIPSVKDVPTYDLCPAMRAREIADAAIDRIGADRYGFVLINFANGDMVGHTGVFDAAVKAVRAVDEAVGRVVEAAKKRGWSVLITSDHGNVEQMKDPATGAPHTAHTTNPVPFILVDDSLKDVTLGKDGGLRDIAPTVLRIMDIEKPRDMEGIPLFD